MKYPRLHICATIIAALFWFAPPASAQTQAQAVTVCGSLFNGPLKAGNYYPITMDLNGKICDNPTGSGAPTPVTSGPPKLTAYGTRAVTSSSVALSTLTPGPNSPAWTTAYPSNYVSIRNSIASAGSVYFCPLGGTCSATVGEPIAVGETIFRNVASGTAITLFSTAGATVVAEE